MTSPAAGGEPRDATVRDVVNVLWRYRLGIVLLPLVLMAVGIASGLMSPRTYTASAAFLLKGDNSAQGVAGLAAQFGVAVPGKGGDTPQLYAELLTSRRLLNQLAATRFTFVDQGRRRSGTVAELYGLGGGTHTQVRDRVRSVLAGSVSATTDFQTGVVTYHVVAPWAPLAEQMADRLQQLVTEFNLNTRQSQAAAERKFTQARLAEARADLRRAEDATQSFLQGNRGFETSPRLLFEYQRLQQVLLSRQGLYATLEQAYANARISEVRDTPVLTVIETAADSAVPNSRGTALRGFVGLVLGLMVAVTAAFVRDFIRRSREHDALEARGQRGTPATAGVP